MWGDTAPAERVDLFISHAGRDRAWAEWVGWELEQAGYSVELDLWDWDVGANVVEKIRDGLQRCDRMLALFSDAYFEVERHTTIEWTSLLHVRDAARPLILPLRIEEVTRRVFLGRCCARICSGSQRVKRVSAFWTWCRASARTGARVSRQRSAWSGWRLGAAAARVAAIGLECASSQSCLHGPRSDAC
ncbi:toll/interleukin-1 receptor domain-containing protein [Micromonospora sp. M12]